VDEAAARLKMEITSKPEELDEIDRKILQLKWNSCRCKKKAIAPPENGWKDWKKNLPTFKEEQRALNAQWQSEKDVLNRIQSIKEEIDRVNVEIQQAERDYDLNKAAELKYGKLTELQASLQQAESHLAATQTSGKSLLREEVTEADIAEIISKWTGYSHQQAG
jgi:ATP-dependent Clp protease ATP-binding subunit ClpB